MVDPRSATKIECVLRMARSRVVIEGQGGVRMIMCENLERGEAERLASALQLRILPNKVIVEDISS